MSRPRSGAPGVFGALGVLGALGAACSAGVASPVQGTAVEHGRAVFEDPGASPSTLNRVACATCHVAEPRDEDGRIFPGATLAGATRRAAFWAGQEDDLLRAVNTCRTYFMGARDPWTRDDEEARVLYAYLDTLPGEARPVPFTVLQAITDLPPGDRARGAEVYSAACGSCHGAAVSGLGRITERAPLLPQQTLEEHSYLKPTERRLVFVEKVRHGVFLGYSGTMPPFSVEALSDADLGALLAYLGVY